MAISSIPRVMSSTDSASPPSELCKIQVLIADDHEIILRGLCNLLTSSRTCEVVGLARTGEEAIAKAKEVRPDVALLDVSMPILNGIEATGQIIAESPETHVIILTGYESEHFANAALQAGALGYLLKSDAASDLVAAVESVASGRPFFSTPLAQRVLQGYLQAQGKRGPEEYELGLTARERQVIQLLAEGYINKEVASRQGIALKTAERYHANIMKKLNCRSISDLVHFAVRNGIIIA